MLRAISLLAVLCLLAGCVRTVSEERLGKIYLTTTGSTLGEVNYLGRKGGFDYFESRWSDESGRYRVVAPNKLIGDQYFPHGTQRVRWSPWYSQPYLDPSGKPAAAPFELGETELFRGMGVKTAPIAR